MDGPKLRKRCRHGRGLARPAATRAWRACGCVWGVDLTVDGVRSWHPLGPDERRARVALHRLVADLEEGVATRPHPGLGFSEVADRWIAALQADVDTKPATLANRQSCITHLKRWFGDIPIPAIQQDHLNRFVASMLQARAKNTVAGAVSTLRVILRWAAQQGVERPRLDFDGVTPRASQRKPGHTVAELVRVLDALPEVWAHAAEFALLTGLRMGEILALTVDDVDGTRVRVDGTWNRRRERGTTKTEAGTRVVTLSPRAVEIVRARVAAVASSPDRRLWPYVLSTAGDALREGMRAAGVYRRGYGWHSLRHAHTAILNEGGVSLRDAAARLGHGPNFAQSLAYGWASEQVDASVVDDVVTRHVGS